jgi:uncharacterized protein (DUF924 family)
MGGLIWLASYPKSGNTWMRGFLHNLLLNAPEPVDPDELSRFCIGESAAVHYGKRVGKDMSEATLTDIMKVRASVHADFTFASPDSVFVKTHNHMGECQGYPLVNMNVTAGGIYIIRNPLDVVLSARHHFGLSIDNTIRMMAEANASSEMSRSLVPEIYSSWSHNVKSWTAHPSPQLLVLRYEDMLEKPQETFGNVARFLGLDPPPERLERAIRNSSFDSLKALEAEKGFRERSKHSESFFRKGQAGQWREELTEEQVRRIVSDHRAQMQRFGYIPEEFA